MATDSNIKPAPAPAPTKAGVPTVKSVSAPTQAAAALGLVQTQLKGYIDAMQPAQPLTPENCIKQQIGLWRTLSLIFQQPVTDFAVLWGEVLNSAHANSKGVFSQLYLFRGFSLLKGKMTDADINNFKALLNLIVQTADPTTRIKKRNLIDLGGQLKGFANPAVSQLLQEFYRA